MKGWILVCCVLTALVSGPVHLLTPAAAWAADRVALVVGNSRYRNLPALVNPTNDAAGMTRALKELGFKVSGGVDLSFDRMRAEMVSFFSNARDAEVALFYFAGHGVQVDGYNYLLPVDSLADSNVDLDFHAISANAVLRQLDGVASSKIMILDACRDNPFSDGPIRRRGVAGLAEMAGGQNTRILFATQPGNVALDGTGGNSPFTKALLAHLPTPNQGFATTVRAVTADVSQSTDGAQLPWMTGSASIEVYLNGEPQPGAPVNGVADKEALFWEIASRYDQADLYRAYIDEYPQGRHVADARNRLGLSSAGAVVAIEPVPSAGPVDVASVEPTAAPAPGQRKVPTIIEEPGWLDIMMARSEELDLDLSITETAQITRRLTLLGYGKSNLGLALVGGDRAEFKAWQVDQGYPPTGYLDRPQYQHLLEQSADIYASYIAESNRQGKAEIDIEDLLRLLASGTTAAQ